MAGTVKSTKMNKTIIVRRNYFHFIPKYQRCESLPAFTHLQAPLLPAAACAVDAA